MGTLQLRVMAEFQAMERVWIYTSSDCMNANTLIINFATLDTVLRIGLTLERLTAQLDERQETASHDACLEIFAEFRSWKDTCYVKAVPDASLVHPLHFVSTLQRLVSDTTVVCCDVGTVYIYMSRYFFCYLPRHFLVSNGQQTLGVGKY